MKKHKLLREDILPAMASNRKVQRLLNEFMDLLSEYETAEPNPDQKNPSAPPVSTPLNGCMDSAPPAGDQIDSSLGVAAPRNSAMPVTDIKESAPSETENVNSAPVETDQLNSVVADEGNRAAATTGTGS